MHILHLCALKMRMATLLFADENTHLWAFRQRGKVYNALGYKAIYVGFVASKFCMICVVVNSVL
jgi:hypothetical protein